MNGFIDPQDDARWKRALQRDRLRSLIRGWLRQKRAPRLTILLLLIVCAAAAACFDAWMQSAGVELRPMRWMAAVIPCWPLFVGLLRWRVAAEWQRLDLDRLGPEFIRHDEAAEALAGTPKAPWSQETQEGIEIGVRSGLQQGGGGGGLLIMVVLTALTLGGWLIWELIRNGPRLIADTMIDAEVLPSRPDLAGKVVTYPWLPETLGATALHFIGLAIAAFLLGTSWLFDFV